MNDITQDHKNDTINIIKEFFVYIDEARKMTDHDRNLMGDYKNDPTLRYPQTKSEYIVDKRYIEKVTL